MRTDVRLQMSRQLQRFLRRAPEDFKRAAATALYQEAEPIMTESKQQTPVDTGALRSSGHIQQPVISGDQVTVEMGYGGPAASYAEIVHEKLDVHHPVGKAKYLEDPFNEAKPGLPGRIGRRIMRQVGD